MTRVYLKLTVYNYNAYPRQEQFKFYAPTVAQAKTLARRLRILIGSDITYNRTRRWTRDHLFGIDGFIERVDGIFIEETRRVE